MTLMLALGSCREHAGTFPAGLPPGRVEVGAGVVAGALAGLPGLGSFGSFLDAPPEPEQGHDARHGHDRTAGLR